MVSSSGAMRIPHQLVFQSVTQMRFINQATQATTSELDLPVLKGARKGIGREIVPFLRRILQLSWEEDLLPQAHATNVVSLGTGQGTALLFSVQNARLKHL